MDGVGRADHQILFVLIVARIVGQGEQIARAKPAHVARRVHQLVLALPLLEANLDACVAVGLLEIVARIVEHLRVGVRVFLWLVERAQQRRPRRLEVEVRRRVTARPDSAAP